MSTRAAKDAPIQHDRPLLKHRAEEVRAQIQATQLMKRWHDLANGTIKGDAALLAVQERAIKGILAKCVPDQTHIEQDIKSEASIHITVEQIK